MFNISLKMHLLRSWKTMTHKLRHSFNFFSSLRQDLILYLRLASSLEQFSCLKLTNLFSSFSFLFPYLVNYIVIPEHCLPGYHCEDVRFVGKGFFQSRTLGMDPGWLAAFSYSHFEGTVRDLQIIISHLYYMEACPNTNNNKRYLYIMSLLQTFF